MNKKILTTASIIAAITALTLISRGDNNPAQELRPQTVQQMQREVSPPDLNDFTNKALQQIQADNTTEPQVAGTTEEEPTPSINQVIEKEITDDSVKIKIQQEVDSSEPIQNKVQVKVDTNPDPPLVEVNTEPKSTNCSQDTYNCTDFSTCSQAKTAFNACATDIHRLDRDDDGIPCNTLCE